jgi:NitT/TauT family transport system ATP-binding protein
LAGDDQFVRADSLSATYAGGVDALAGLHLAIPRGQFLSIVGPSGCGKSTLLRLVAGLLEPSAGQLRVAGQRPAVARRTAARVSFVFQDATLLPWRSVAGNIRLPLELQGAPRREQQAIVERGLDLVGLKDFAHRYPQELSGGMRMRVALARALATEPDLLLLDEPFAALDDISRSRLNEELQRLWSARGWTAIFVTHNIAEAVFLSQRVLVMTPRPGRICADIPVPLAPLRTEALRADATYARLVGEVQSALKRAAA